MANKKHIKDYSLFNADDVAFLQEIKQKNSSPYNDPVSRAVLVKINTITSLLRNVKTEIRMELPHTMPGLAIWWRVFEYKNTKLGNPIKTWSLLLEQSTIFTQVRKLSIAQLKLIDPYLDKFLSFAVQKLREKQ